MWYNIKLVSFPPYSFNTQTQELCQLIDLENNKMRFTTSTFLDANHEMPNMK